MTTTMNTALRCGQPKQNIESKPKDMRPESQRRADYTQVFPLALFARYKSHEACTVKHLRRALYTPDVVRGARAYVTLKGVCVKEFFCLIFTGCPKNMDAGTNYTQAWKCYSNECPVRASILSVYSAFLECF
ncbi:hypothetical protein AeRB84_005354 [Aphanomyces euteiches]|nr:hypothetical protein AeRB84_005354 [Aphanomyces euteiches]